MYGYVKLQLFCLHVSSAQPCKALGKNVVRADHIKLAFFSEESCGFHHMTPALFIHVLCEIQLVLLIAGSF